MSLLYQRTPLIKASDSAAARLGVRAVYLKLDNLQPSGSFKIRGISHHVRRTLAGRSDTGPLALISSSGGNAGMAVAYVGKAYSLPTIIFVPKTTAGSIIHKLEELGAQVRVVGSVWDEAHQAAVAYCNELGAAQTLYVHPFDHPDLWEGHSTLVDEIVEDGVLPDLVVCSVGGGGLLGGILQGLAKHQLPQTLVAAVETDGAASWRAAQDQGLVEPVAISEISTIAKTLGARAVSAGVLKLARAHPAGVVSVLVSDRAAVQSCLIFADEYRFLVEPACGASLALLDDAALFKQSFPTLGHESVVVVEVCGGSGVNLELLSDWKSQTGLAD
ncbi:threonine dehydratase [Polychytrium aggregatum]|uniref:threonine dehydratase n=1 Tax=Polychytrium aggregatum TaxID=110093 RepID=UPI0022FF0BDE|nr:threonine dehydratase [Polychytrium aggregatum]KAI9204806.1 threonine dehydratase [Polychytrium aggregatum]